MCVGTTYVSKKTLDGARPFQALRASAPTFKDHVQKCALHSPQRAFSGVKVVLILQELIHEFFGCMMEKIGLFLFKVVESSNGEDGEEKRWFGAFRTEGHGVEEGEMVMKEIEIGRQVKVDGWQGRENDVSA